MYATVQWMVPVWQDESPQNFLQRGDVQRIFMQKFFQVLQTHQCCPHNNNQKQQTNQWETKTEKTTPSTLKLIPPQKKIQHQHQTKTARKVFSDTSPHPSFLKDSVCTVAILLLGICWWTHLQGHPPTWKHTKSTRVHWSEDDRFLYRKKRNRCRSCRPGEFDKSCLFFGGFMWLDVC